MSGRDTPGPGPQTEKFLFWSLLLSSEIFCHTCSEGKTDKTLIWKATCIFQKK